jgi:hypothetical protein
VAFVIGQYAHLGEHVGMGDRGADVLGVESAVEAHAFGELLDAPVGRLVKNTTPRFVCQRIAPRGLSDRRASCRGLLAMSNIFTVNGLRRIVNERRAAVAQKIGNKCGSLRMFWDDTSRPVFINTRRWAVSRPRLTLSPRIGDRLRYDGFGGNGLGNADSSFGICRLRGRS